MKFLQIFFYLISVDGFLQNSKIDLDIIHKYKNLFREDSYNNIIREISTNHVSKIFIDNNYKELISVDNIINNDAIYDHYHISNIDNILVPKILDKAFEFQVPIYFTDFTPQYILFFQKIMDIIPNIISIIFIGYVFLNLLKNTNTNNNQFFTTNMDGEFINPNVSLDNWAGSSEVIEECNEIILYLENKEKYKEIGADMPKGILLEGPPGTGKTLLAKAIASETNSTFISLSGSEFVELFVGMGASKVRDLFEVARENAPSVIFIDEIDAIGKQRGGNINLGNDEREQTLNQLLYEMDGFNDNDNIIVLAATNRKDVLDKALLRPGRFDRIIKVPLPDKSSREQIIHFYLSNKKINKKFDINYISELTDGFSGADLKNLINEAAILSVKNNYKFIQEKYIFDAFEKSIVGLIKHDAIVPKDIKLRVAIHESGHSLLVLKYKQYFDLLKVSITPTYNGAGGYTLFTEKSDIKEGGLYTKDLLTKRLAIIMAGKAAENIYYGTDFVSLGASQDLNEANKLAKQMIENYGMGIELNVFYNLEDINTNFNSEYIKHIIDKESLDLVNNAYNEAQTILNANKEQLLFLSELLQNNTVIYKHDLHNFIHDSSC